VIATTDEPEDTGNGATTEDTAGESGGTDHEAGTESARGGRGSAAGSDTSDDPTRSVISHDDCFDLLSNHRRRYALHYLQRHGEEATLGELADHVAAWENDVDVEAVSPTQRKRVYTSLQQVHLPRMDDLDVVEFDDVDGRVAMGPAATDLDVYLEVVRDDDVPWSAFYLGLALVNAALVGGVLLSVPLLSSVPGVGWTLFVLMTFLVASLSHQYLTAAEMLLGRGDRPPGSQSH